MILIVNQNKQRLCQDNRWRSFANFGTLKECVKEYSNLGHARRKAERVNGTVVHIPKDAQIDSSGRVYREVEVTPGYNRVENIDINTLKVS